MGQFAQGVGHDFDRADLERPIDFLPRGKPLAVSHRGIGRSVGFPRQILERLILRIARHIGRLEPGESRRAVFVPGERIVQQRLAQPKMIAARQPLGLGEEIVQSHVGRKAQRTVFPGAFQFQAGALVFQRRPIRAGNNSAESCGR